MRCVGSYWPTHEHTIALQQPECQGTSADVDVLRFAEIIATVAVHAQYTEVIRRLVDLSVVRYNVTRLKSSHWLKCF